jgi:hypothetical protein
MFGIWQIGNREGRSGTLIVGALVLVACIVLMQCAL